MFFRGPAYDCDDSVSFEQVVQSGEEFLRKERGGLGASCEDVMDNIIESVLCLVFSAFFDERDRVLYHSGVICGKVEITGSVPVHNRVDLYNRGLDTMSNQC